MAKALKRARKSPYSLHPAYKMEAAYRANLETRTGKSFEEWVAFAMKYGPKGEKERIAWLRKEHGLTMNYAWWVGAYDKGGHSSAEYDPERFVDDLFSGPKSSLRPLYEHVLDLGMGLGKDVKACPCQTMVPLYRKYVFAEIKPTATSRIDLGLALGAQRPVGRLESLGRRAAGNRITHRIILNSENDVDAEVKKWIAAAYALGDTTRQRPKMEKASEPPADFKKALAASKKASATFETLTPRMKGDWSEWITQAAKAETRSKRINTAIEKLEAGKKRMY